MEYGGIYTDLDVIVLKSFDPLLKYNTTLGYETGNGSPDGLCNGVIISRPHAKFLEIWYHEYKNFRDSQWGVHSVLLPAKLAKIYPSLIHTEQTTLHRPNWMELNKLYKDGAIYDWSQNYAVHLWYRFHKVDHNPEDIKTINTTMGEMFRYIYYGKKDLIL
jgi:mannosyltransferase OCH1-like enzyme